MDCLEGMRLIADASVDMILCDLPYGTTQNKWDSVIPFDPLWEQYRRVIKSNGAIVLTASQPFTSELVTSNREWFKYEWIWVKNQPSGIGIAKYQPMRNHEHILVFARGRTVYIKQETRSLITDRKLGRSNGKFHSNSQANTGIVTKKPSNPDNILLETVNPRTVLHFPIEPNAKGKLHPTQKPVALFEYLVQTYTNPGDLVLDNCMGSGTTAIACLNTGRNYIGFENNEVYYETTLKRIATHSKSTLGQTT